MIRLMRASRRSGRSKINNRSSSIVNRSGTKNDRAAHPAWPERSVDNPRSSEWTFVIAGWDQGGHRGGVEAAVR
jgi:hypothetical protein